MTKICSSCQTINKDKSKFCRKCGEKFNVISENNYGRIITSSKCNVRLNKNTLLNLHDISIIKEDINQYGLTITENSLITLYENYFSIENNVFAQNIPYNLLKHINFQKTKHTLELILTNQSNIILKIEENSINQIYEILNNKIINYNLINQNNHFQSTNVQQMNQQPVNQKSIIIAIILHVLFMGLGYAYVNKWEKFAITIGLEIVCIFTFFLIIPLFLLALIWIYTLIDTINMVEKYNKGEPY